MAHSRVIGFGGWLAGTFCAAALISGCGSSGPVVTADPYRGPPITIDSTGSRHRIVLEAPSSGWTIAFDNAKRTFDHTDVFITITRPDPAYMHAQGVVRQYLESMVDSKDRMTTYARVHDFGKKSGNYQKATETGK